MSKKEQISKLKKFIKDDRPSRFKSYVRKYKLPVKDIELKKGRSLLHYCCQYGSGVILRYLLNEGLATLEPDRNGNLPLHICLQRALDAELHQSKEVYAELVLPLLETTPQALDEHNLNHVSCRNLLEQLVEKNSQETSFEDADTQEQWSERLEEEMSQEQDEMFGRYMYHNEYDTWSERTHETYDQWADRIFTDRKLKHRFGRNESPHSNRNSKKSDPEKAKRSSVIDEEKLKRTREELKRKYDERQKIDRESHKKRRKCLYEKNFAKLLDKKDTMLTFDDIPWPSRGSIADVLEVLFSEFPDKRDQSYRTYLKKQQVMWHPDKFTQKFGKRIVDLERDRIMSRVKEISQALNKLSDS